MLKKILLIFIFIILLILPAKAEEIGAKGAVVTEAATGEIIFGKNENERLPMASTTKIMTALLIIENCDINSEYTVSKSAAEIEGSRFGLYEGEKVKISELLYMLLLISGNDAAVTLAEGYAGSEEKFAEKMNEKAAELGCNNTHFTNPHGLPDENHYTTAKDLAVIAAEAYEYPLFRKIISTAEYKTEKGTVIKNSNRLLTEYEGCKGGKTGYTKKAGRCLVSFAERDGLLLICVTLSCPDDWNIHKKLLDDCFSMAEKTVLFPAGKFEREIRVFNGEKAITINTEVLKIKTFGNGKGYKISAEMPKMLFSPLTAGKTVGKVTVSNRYGVVSESPLAIKKTVTERETEADFSRLYTYGFKRILYYLLSYT